MKYLLVVGLIACAASLATAAPSLEQGKSLFENFKKMFAKFYSTIEEEQKRFAFFMKNYEHIYNHNAAGDAEFRLGVNHLMDLSPEEYKQMNGLRVPPKRLSSDPKAAAFYQSILANDAPVPEELDWREVPGRVTPVKDQKSCGSCWAFAAVGTIEGQELEHNKSALIGLSEQDLVDCSKNNAGCDGGLMENALNDIASLGGIESEADYPYKGVEGECRFEKRKSVFTDSGAFVLEEGDEEKLKAVVAKYGPVAVGIDASAVMFQFYKHGVYYNKRCRNKQDQLDHGVLVVGYGTDSKQGPYWIVKNSWGPSWGEKGYVRMARNRKNHCGIATVATIATFDQ